MALSPMLSDALAPRTGKSTPAKCPGEAMPFGKDFFRSGGVPEAAADVDGARQFKWSHVMVEGIQHEIQGSCCVMKTHSSADSRLRSE